MLQRVKVLYIMGLGRSGSTLLGNILGLNEGWVSIGERHKFWRAGLLSGMRCGCKESIPECALWKQVASDVLGDYSRADLEKIVEWQVASMRQRHVPRLLKMDQGASDWPELDGMADVTDRFFESLGARTSATVIVDSSKVTEEAALLRLLPHVDAYVIHLVRDARAVAFSRLRTKRAAVGEEPYFLPRMSPVRSSIYWDAGNFIAAKVARVYGDRSLTIRYEDFVRQPQETIERIASLVGEETRSTLSGSDRPEMGVHHTIGGNPIRFDPGPIQIRIDDEWTRKMRRGDFLKTTLLCLPGLLRQGYGVRRPRTEVRSGSGSSGAVPTSAPSRGPDNG